MISESINGDRVSVGVSELKLKKRRDWCGKKKLSYRIVIFENLFLICPVGQKYIV